MEHTPLSIILATEKPRIIPYHRQPLAVQWALRLLFYSRLAEIPPDTPADNRNDSIRALKRWVVDTCGIREPELSEFRQAIRMHFGGER